MREFLTEEKVEQEIARLSASPYVKLAQREVRAKYKRRQYLYQLRILEKRGRELDELGVTADMIDENFIAKVNEDNEKTAR